VQFTLELSFHPISKCPVGKLGIEDAHCVLHCLDWPVPNTHSRSTTFLLSLIASALESYRTADSQHRSKTALRKDRRIPTLHPLKIGQNAFSPFRSRRCKARTASARLVFLTHSHSHRASPSTASIPSPRIQTRNLFSCCAVWRSFSHMLALTSCYC
jgi:hypothetical protein